MRATRVVVLLALPCSPWMAQIGYGPHGRSAAVRLTIISRQSSSEATLRNGRRSSTDPPGSGTGRGSIPLARRNFTGGCASTRHPSRPTRTARQSGSTRSR